MAATDKPGSEKRTTEAAGVLRQVAAAMELPFVLLGSVVAGGLLGYAIDSWLHSKPLGLLICGALGFAAGIRELLRRLSKDVR
ncbi:MAG TPA: AtpZ/AtpI family protein [Candidatus Acidoferrales bacterium]|nr:AtpZ/AtpI family protein [Candidatus Acidoferrales bacterium]